MRKSVAASRWLIIASALLVLSCRDPGVGNNPAAINGNRPAAGSPPNTQAVAAPDVQNMNIVLGFRNALGQSCRVVEQTIVIGGQRTPATGTMCQRYDGHWEIVP
jgi:surface antigen